MKTAAAILLAAVVAGVAVYFWQHGQMNTLLAQNADLTAQRDSLTKERDDAVAAAAKSAASGDLSTDKEELLRLRGEVGALRRQTNELNSLRQQNRQLQDALAQTKQTAQQNTQTADQQAAMVKMNNAKQLALGLIMYSADHQNNLPNDITDATNYWTDPNLIETFKNQFDLVGRGSLQGLTNAADTIIARERAPAMLNGNWTKVYAFVDGHVEVKQQPPEGFDAWEQQHMMPPPPSQ
jgi:hypothetical protein